VRWDRYRWDKHFTVIIDFMTNQSYVYIDGANLHQWVKDRWGIDYRKFKIWLCDKYKAQTIYLFIWYIKGKEQLYSQLSQWWYTLIFKETLEIDGKVKWNCDAELVVKALSGFYELSPYHSVIVTWDGDFACLLDFFIEKGHKHTLLAPNKKYCSYLLKKRNSPIVLLEDIRQKFQ
jgi:uncharacterized LabA/DUF88 family protein